MEDLRWVIVGNIYTNSTTAFHGNHFRSMPLLIPIKRGTTQGDTQGPNLFHIFLDPLLRWLEKRRHCKLRKSTTNIPTHLLHKGFCISKTFLLPDYISYIGQWLIQASNNQWQLGIIYQGLAKHICAKIWRISSYSQTQILSMCMITHCLHHVHTWKSIQNTHNLA